MLAAAPLLKRILSPVRYSVSCSMKGTWPTATTVPAERRSSVMKRPTSCA